MLLHTQVLTARCQAGATLETVKCEPNWMSCDIFVSVMVFFSIALLADVSQQSPKLIRYQQAGWQKLDWAYNTR